jgi:hypothetical protein
MAAMDDALAEARAGHPHWGVLISSAGRYWATRLGNLRLAESARTGWAMTVDANSPAELEIRIRTQEEYGQA